MEDFVAPLVEEVRAMPEAWTAAIGAIKTGMGDVMTTITTDTLLLALSFGFIFVRKGIGIVKKLIRIGGKS